MESALIASLNPPLPACLRPKITVRTLKSWNYKACCHLFPSTDLHSRQPFARHPIKAQAAERRGKQNKIMSHLNDLTSRLRETLPKPLQEFPLKEAKYMVTERLLLLGQRCLKWSFIALFVVSFVSDVSLAISRNRELLIPLGLFIGVALAEFLRESSQDLYQRITKDRDSGRLLLGIGSIFVLMKLISLCFKLQGRVLLSHMGNGGLMEVLYLARNVHQNDDVINQQEQTLDAPPASRLTD